MKEHVRHYGSGKAHTLCGENYPLYLRIYKLSALLVKLNKVCGECYARFMIRELGCTCK